MIVVVDNQTNDIIAQYDDSLYDKIVGIYKNDNHCRVEKLPNQIDIYEEVKDPNTNEVISIKFKNFNDILDELLQNQELDLESIKRAKKMNLERDCNNYIHYYYDGKIQDLRSAFDLNWFTSAQVYLNRVQVALLNRWRRRTRYGLGFYIHENRRILKSLTEGYSGRSRPRFQRLRKGDTVRDYQVVWKCIEYEDIARVKFQKYFQVTEWVDQVLNYYREVLTRILNANSIQGLSSITWNFSQFDDSRPDVTLGDLFVE